MNENRCVCCGEIIPEGRQVCHQCEVAAKNGTIDWFESFGALFSKKDVRDYQIDCSTVPAEFPTEFELKMPNVKSQGSVGSCVAHAIATTIEYFNKLQENNSDEMSVGYIYGNRTNTTHTGKGMYMRDAIANTCKYGDVTKDLFPYNEEVPGIIHRFEDSVGELFDKGCTNRFTSYYRLYTVDEIKTSLINNGPVIFAIKWYKDIKVVDGMITTSQNVDGGGHCMVIYGWDERGWKIQNSWGAKWSKNGRAVLPYEVKIREAWGIVDTLSGSTTNVVKPYSSKFGKIVAKIFNALINYVYWIIGVIK